MELSAIVLVIGGMASLFVSAYKLGHYKGHAKGYTEAGEFYGDSRVGRAVDMSGDPDDGTVGVFNAEGVIIDPDCISLIFESISPADDVDKPDVYMQPPADIPKPPPFPNAPCCTVDGNPVMSDELKRELTKIFADPSAVESVTIVDKRWIDDTEEPN